MSPTIVSAGLGSPEAAMLERLLPQITLADGPHEAIAVRAPYTGSTIGTIPAGTVADLELAVQRARAAQMAWSRRTFAERAGIFLRFHDLLLGRQDEVLDLIQWETGKARRHAFEEVLDTAIVTRYYARWTRDTARGARLARQIRAGNVNVNEAYAATWGSVDAPCGGRKESGMHARHGAEGILKFTETQTVAVQYLVPVGAPDGMDPSVYACWMTRLLKLLRHIRVLG
jgi:acyl-CoA reductase-like NAD-dependent aldehyde dehydrogenase